MLFYINFEFNCVYWLNVFVYKGAGFTQDLPLEVSSKADHMEKEVQI